MVGILKKDFNRSFAMKMLIKNNILKKFVRNIVICDDFYGNSLYNNNTFII